MPHPNLFRDRSVADVIAIVNRAERKIGVGTTKERRFVKVGSWLVEAGHFRGLWSDLGAYRSSTVVPFFAARPRYLSALRVLRNWAWSKGVSAPIAADAICVRNNIRTFYLNRPDPFSLKIPKHDSNALKGFQRDVEARERVLKHGFLNVPKIIASDLNSDDSFLTEEIVFGRLPQLPADAATVTELVGNSLWKTYSSEGFRFKSISQTFNIDDHGELLAKACEGCSWDSRWLPRQDFMNRAGEVLSSPGLITFSYGHGDFGIHNIILTKDSDPYVIDWEHARRMVTVRDLFRSLTEVPGVYEAVRDRMDALCASQPELPVLSFTEQFLTVALQPLLIWARRGRRNHPELARRKSVVAVLHLANRILLQERDHERGVASYPFSAGLGKRPN